MFSLCCSWKVAPWTYSPKLTAQKHQLMYSLTPCLCCAESKRSCCAVRLLISQACVHALTYTLTPPTQDFSQETEANEWEMKASHRAKSWSVKVKEQKDGDLSFINKWRGTKWRSGLMYLRQDKKTKRWDKEWRRTECLFWWWQSQNHTQGPSGGNRSGDSRQVLHPSMPAVGDGQEESHGLPLSKTRGDPAFTGNLSPDAHHFKMTERHVCYDGLWTVIVQIESGCWLHGISAAVSDEWILGGWQTVCILRTYVEMIERI